MNNTGYIWQWAARMAWRDCRRNLGRLTLFTVSIVLGISGLVAINSLNDNIGTNINEQAAALLGADLEISNGREPEASVLQLIDSLPGKKASELSCASMVLFPKNSGTRLVQVRALEGDFPFYGQLETIPVDAAREFRSGDRLALVDQTLLIQYDAQPGDSVKVGELTFKIAGKLTGAPGQSGITASVAPVVYIGKEYFEATGLQQKGSRINYHYYFQFETQEQTTSVTEKIEPVMEAASMRLRTVETQKKDTGRFFDDLTRFMSLVGFVALLLGCIGVASSVQLYIKEKFTSIAVLRCLGATGNQAFLIYLIQIAGIGFIGSAIGVITAMALQQLLPVILKDLVPVTITTSLSYLAVINGLLTGTVVAVLFGLLPLLSIRKIAPLHVISHSFSPPDHQSGRLITLLVYGLISLFIFFYAWLQLKNGITALAFTAAVIVIFVVLWAVATLLMRLIKRYFPFHWQYLTRQGLANLYRPQNQTVILIIAIGLSTTLLGLLITVRTQLLNSISLSTAGDRPNMVLFDIQTPQLDSLQQLAVLESMPVIQTVPIINIRLEQHNQLTFQSLLTDSTSQRRIRNMFSREYRVTYRDSLSDAEKITDGKWVGNYQTGNGLPPVSVEKGFAERNEWKLGDTLVFNVQGRKMETVVASLREVNWGSMQTNFVVIFPNGLLENAPKFHVILTKVESEAQSAAFQQKVVKAFPNISIVDLGLVMNVVSTITEKVGTAIRFMAGFSILTGFIVLISSVLISKYQRIKESVLLRTLGATRRQVLFITMVEYLFLGLIAALVGILLALGAGWAIITFSFKTAFQPDFVPLILLLVIIPALTVLIGVVNTRSILNRSPLEILRQEG